jgi:hypothetical protein
LQIGRGRSLIANRLRPEFSFLLVVKSAKFGAKTEGSLLMLYYAIHTLQIGRGRSFIASRLWPKLLFRLIFKSAMMQVKHKKNNMDCAITHIANRQRP